MQTIQLLSKSQALAIARQNCHMYRQGKQWIVSAFCESVQCWRESHSVDYWHARTAVAVSRINTACELLGWPSGEQAYLDRNPSDNPSWTAYVQPYIQTTY